MQYPDLQQDIYPNVRAQMQPGDIIAFAGRSRISRLINRATASNITHVGIVTHAMVSHLGSITVEIMESVKEGECPETGQIITGVTRNRLSSKLRHYDGTAYWLPLSHATREKLDYTAAIKFLMSVLGRPYDMPQAILSAFDGLDFTERVTYAAEDYSSLFCSELAAAALKAGGVLGPHFNPSEITPVDLLRLPIYFKHYYQLTGLDPAPIIF